MAEDDEVVAEVRPSDYLVTQTREVHVTGPSAADARKTAELIFQLTPNNPAVTTTIHVEKLRH